MSLREDHLVAVGEIARLVPVDRLEFLDPPAEFLYAVVKTVHK
jgi:hypothetical protein